MQQLIQRGKAGSVPGMEGVLSRLLFARGIETPEEAQRFLHPSPEQLLDPMTLPGAAEAVEIIRRHIADGSRITVYGDYDCDGVCATALLTEILTQAGAKDVQKYIPSREEEGYGLNCAAVEQIATTGGLLITVDCGITSVKETALAHDLGMEVIITDHHTIPDPVPPADALVHSALGGYGCPYLCGAGTAWKLGCALLGHIAWDQIELAALATVADMVPLTGENRVIAALGLKNAACTERHPGLKALMEIAKVPSDHPVSGSDTGFKLGPRINACGRLKSADIAFEMLTTRDAAVAKARAEEADRLNTKRKKEEDRILQNAESQLRLLNLCREQAVVIAGRDWPKGVVGLAAGRVSNKYGYPTVVLSLHDGLAEGSARTASGVDIYRALADCGDIFVKFGGHPAAAGMTLKEENVPLLRERLNEAVRKQLNGRAPMPVLEYDCELRLNEISETLIEELAQLEPCGTGNPSPAFLMQDVNVIKTEIMGVKRGHLRMTLEEDGLQMGAVAFGMADWAERLGDGAGIICVPTVNSFRGNNTLQCMVLAITAGGGFQLTRSMEGERMIGLLKQLGQSPAMKSVTGELPKAIADQGTLLVCHTVETARTLKQMYPHLDAEAASIPDPRAYSRIWLCDRFEKQGPYEHVVLADGAVAPEEIYLFHSLYPETQLTVLPQSENLKLLLDSMRPSKDEMRMLYSEVRGKKAHLDTLKKRMAAEILAHMDLITVEPLTVRPFKKADPAEDGLYRLLNPESD